MSMSHTQEVTYRWIAGLLAAIVLAMAGGWAQHINGKVDTLQEAVSVIRSDISAIRQMLRRAR
jgi:hypothetical protein